MNLIIPPHRAFLAQLLIPTNGTINVEAYCRICRETATGKIRITKVPAGEAPLGIRKKWVGLILPCEPIAGSNDTVKEYGVVSRRDDGTVRQTVSVPQDLAILVLRQQFPQAAAWWVRAGYPRHSEWFSFGLDEVEIIEGVTIAKVKAYEDAGQGGEPLSGNNSLDR
jgi:hypothetical protein